MGAGGEYLSGALRTTGRAATSDGSSSVAARPGMSLAIERPAVCRTVGATSRGVMMPLSPRAEEPEGRSAETRDPAVATATVPYGRCQAVAGPARFAGSSTIAAVAG